MNEKSKSTVNTYLQHERHLRGWSQQELADLLATAPVTVSRWERGVQKPAPIMRLKLCSLFGKRPKELGLVPEDSQSETLTKTEIGMPLERVQLTRSLDSPPLWVVAYSRNPFFTGREELLRSLHEKFIRQHTLALTQPWAVSGLGGIGKTQIALEYAYQYRHEYRFVFWVNASTRETLFSDFVTITNLLQLPEKDESECSRMIQAVKEWLVSHHEWLLILDNADDLPIVCDIVPTELSGHILLTTRVQALGALAQRIEVETMGMVEATLFLLRRAKFLAPDGFLDQVADASLVAAEILAIEMDFLPLALDQAGAYIEEVGCSLATYLELYRTHRKNLLSRRGQVPANHPESVVTTWSLSFQKVEQVHLAAADLLRLCAFLEPDTIPEELISKGSAFLGSVLQPVAQDAFKLNEAIEELRKFSLIQRDPDLRLLRIHRLVQAVLKDAMEMEEQRQWMEQAVRATNAVFPEIVEMTTWPHCRRMLSQAQVCSGFIQDNAFAFAEAASLLFRTASYLQDYALYEQAEPLFQRALHIWKQMVGLEPVDIAHILTRLADLYLAQGKLEQAEQLFARVLASREQVLEPDHPLIADTLNSLAIVYREQGKYEQAEPLFVRALMMREQVLGPEHPHTAYILGNLALLYRERGQYEYAESLCLRALSIYEQHLGPDHPHTATGLNNLALTYRDQGKYEQAEPLFVRVLAIREQRRETYHTNTALTLANLATLYREQGQYEHAEPLYLRAFSIYEQQLEADHPLIAQGLNNLATLYRDQGKYEQAEPLYLRALTIREQQLGPDHLQTAETSHGLATVWEAYGNHQAAAFLYQHALLIRKQVLGPQHPKTSDTRERLLVMLRAMGKTEDAILLEEQAK